MNARHAIRSLALLAACWPLWLECAAPAAQASAKLSQPKVCRGAAADACNPAARSPSRDACHAPPPECMRPQDDIWLINTHRVGYSLGCSREGDDLARLYVAQWQGKQGWRKATIEELLAAEPAALTMLYAHGNRQTPTDAIDRSLRFYRAMLRGSDDPAPVRLIIWSWPSSRIPGPLRDARAHAARSDVDAYFLSQLLARWPNDRPLSLVGFSFGARIVTGALQLVAGGSVAGYALPKERIAHFQTEERPPLRAILLAAALDTPWLCPGGYHGLAASMTDRTLNVYNPCDEALKYYHFIARCTGLRKRRNGPSALGYTGLYCAASLPNVAQFSVGPYVGKSHDVRHYTGSEPLMARVRPYVLWKDVPPQKSVVLTQKTANSR